MNLSWAHATIHLKSPAHPGTVFNSMEMGRLSPYLTSHVSKFGVYLLELDRQPPAIDGSDANKISTTIYSGLDDSFSTISCIVIEFLRQNLSQSLAEAGKGSVIEQM
jgi:hypothetical protein